MTDQRVSKDEILVAEFDYGGDGLGDVDVKVCKKSIGICITW